MIFQELIDRPDGSHLTRVLNGRRLDFIAPYVRKGPLKRITHPNHDRVRMIVRLPRPADPPPRVIDNDPRDLLDLVQRLGVRAQVFAFPAVHTKLYLNGAHAFYGSANFTSTGFGRGPESLLRTNDPATYSEFERMFQTYLGQSERLRIDYLRRLSKGFERGEFDYLAAPERPDLLIRNPGADDEGVFRTWLATLGEGDAQYIENRFDRSAGYNMTGHTQSALPGLRAFLRDNLDLVPILAGQSYIPYAFWPRNQEVVARLRDFVLASGHRYPAHGGGAWRHKLPPFLGGSGNPGGGRGSGLIARMLIYLSRYAIDQGY
jgi:hypothetical protein